MPVSDLPPYPSFHLALQDLTVFRSGRQIFAGLSADLTNGGIINLVGPNGSGKSTFLRMLASLLPYQAGDLTFEIEAENGKKTRDVSLKDHLIYLGHKKAHKHANTLLDNSQAWGQLMAGNPLDINHIEKCAVQLSIGPLLMEPVKYFSSGQKQRAALMRLLLIDRPIWLLDEPTVGLDRDGKKVLTDLLQTHQARGGAAIVATHEDIGIKSAELNMKNFPPATNSEGYWL